MESVFREGRGEIIQNIKQNAKVAQHWKVNQKGQQEAAIRQWGASGGQGAFQYLFPKPLSGDFADRLGESQ